MADASVTPVAERYSVIRLLGSGGMSRVWLARDELLHRDVALKASHLGVDAELDREARVLAGLRHPNIVSLFDLTERDGETYLVIEYVDGRSLAELLEERGSIDEPRVRRMGVTLANALAYAHSKGVLHNDIKPANIIIDREGEPHIADFGVAGVIRTTLTMASSSEFVGTLAYLAPEVIGGDRATPSSDVYSLAVTLYQCAAGCLPFPSGTVANAVQRIAHPAPLLHMFAPNAGDRLEQALAKALAVLPGDRYRSAAEFSAALAPGQPTQRLASMAVAAQPALAADAKQSIVAVEPKGRRRWPLAAALLVGGGVALLAAGVRWLGPGATNQLDTHGPTIVAGVAPLASATPTPTATVAPAPSVFPTPTPPSEKSPQPVAKRHGKPGRGD